MDMFLFLHVRLSGYGFIDVGLPPASPSDREIDSAVSEQICLLPLSFGCYNVDLSPSRMTIQLCFLLLAIPDITVLTYG